MFYLNKTLGELLHPSNLMGLCIVAVSAWMLWRGRAPRLLAWLVHAAAVLVLLLVFTPAEEAALAALERWVPRGAMPARVTGVIVLGGWVEAVPASRTDPPNVTGASERLLAALEVARRYPDAKLLFAGGSAQVTNQSISEANGVRLVLEMIGFPMSRVIFEGKSRDTYENAVNSLALAKPGPDDQWLLVTSASHMGRAMACFRRAGFPVIPYPCDYRGDPGVGFGFRRVSDAVNDVDAIVHELLGIAAYWATGRLKF